jgi:hypothetical protein
VNYIPFGPTTNRSQTADKGRMLLVMDLDEADTLVARGFAKIAKEDKMRFSTLLKTIQREAMLRLTYPKPGAAWQPQTTPSFFERHGNRTMIQTWTDATGQAWFQEVAKDKADFPVMTQAHKFTYPHRSQHHDNDL